MKPITKASNRCLHHLVEAQVEKTPNHIAVVYEEQQLTYRELNRRANQLAHYLRSLGVGPGVLVGIYMERSLELAVAVLGALKAAAVCVPLEPSYPHQRLAFMLNDTQISLILTQSHLQMTHIEHITHIVCMDRSDYRNGHCHNPESQVSRENLAFILYTSGSTARPKGVMLAHAGLALSFAELQKNENLIKPEDCLILKASISHSPFLTEFFALLVFGNRVIIAHPNGHEDSRYLLELILKHKVTHIFFTPSLLRAFLREPNVERCSSLKVVDCSGEALPIELQKHFFSRLDAKLYTTYGSTEASGVATWECQPNEERQWHIIGHANPSAEIYVLDDELQMTSVGEIGELYSSNLQMARGYWKRPHLTAERFIEHPFSDKPGALLYKTGDLGSYRPNGVIEFLGRKDSQTKLRGMRIELSEIEGILNEQSGIQECTIIVREDKQGDQRLVAYLVPEGTAPTVTALRKVLAQTLPEQMIPSHFIVMAQLPLTPTGKIDRRALPKPDTARPNLEETFVTPRTPAEEVVANVWQEVLAVSQVGIQDHFFSLGGHSLLASQLIFRLQALFRVDLPLRKLFESPTVEGLVEGLAQLWGGREIVEQIAQTWQEIEQLSASEVKRMLNDDNYLVARASTKKYQVDRQ